MAKKGKKKVLSPEEQQKKQLILKVQTLQQQIGTEEKYLTQFLMEKDTFHKFLQNAKEKQFELQLQLNTKKREFEDFDQRNQVIIQSYKDQVKEFLYQKYDDNTENKFEKEQQLKIAEDQNTKLQNQLLVDLRGFSKNKKQQELEHGNFLFDLKMDQDQVQTSIRRDFERQTKDLKSKYDLKIQKLRNDMQQYSNKVIKDLETEKEKKIKEITHINEKRYKDIKNYYNDIIQSNLSLIKQLKAEITRAQTIEEKDKKQLLKAEETHKRLEEPLRKKTEELKRLKKDKEDWIIVKEKKNQLRNKIEQLEKEYRDIEYLYEIKFQQYQYLEQEYDKLKTGIDERFFDIFQKSGLQNLILEKEQKMIQEEIDQKDYQIKKILLQSNLADNDKELVQNSLLKIQEEKNTKISDLKDQIIQIRQAHLQMVNDFQNLLKENHIPVDELGFQPNLPELNIQLILTEIYNVKKQLNF